MMTTMIIMTITASTLLLSSKALKDHSLQLHACAYTSIILLSYMSMAKCKILLLKLLALVCTTGKLVYLIQNGRIIVDYVEKPRDASFCA